MRIFINEQDKGHRAMQLLLTERGYNRHNVKVYVDGLEIPTYITADDSLGLVTFYNDPPDVDENGQLTTTTLSGDVKIRLTRD